MANILGNGVEIVYVKTDVLDVKLVDHLEKFVDIQWEPRKPTTYLLSVFSIESKLFGVRKIVQWASDTIWRAQRIIIIWKTGLSTLEWSSPDFNPEPPGRMNDVRTSVLENQESSTARFNEIATSFDNGHLQVVKPKLMKNLILADFGQHATYGHDVTLSGWIG